jgi:beta-galactosidase/beta-glucuronidase
MNAEGRQPLLRHWLFVIRYSIFIVLANVALSAESTSPRRVISLDGAWDIAEGSMDSVPARFTHKVPVPGLVDMAKPSFEEVGKKSEKREAFWYRRTFTLDGAVPPAAILKIHKARYGTKVWLNGQVAGEHLPCFTPAHLDVRQFLKGEGQENELIIRVGADRESRPTDVPSGWDFEKYLYIPGIYDSVELILTRTPHVVNVQTVPDPAIGSVRVQITLRSERRAAMFPLDLIVREASSGREVGREAANPGMAENEQKSFDCTIPIKDCHLWSPEDPFLYELEVSTYMDNVKVRFGMRSFRFDAASGRAVLNGKPYFMRGTNVCAYRFFEDAERGDKPWREFDSLLHRFPAGNLV